MINEAFFILEKDLGRCCTLWGAPGLRQILEAVPPDLGDTVIVRRLGAPAGPDTLLCCWIGESRGLHVALDAQVLRMPLHQVGVNGPPMQIEFGLRKGLFAAKQECKLDHKDWY